MRQLVRANLELDPRLIRRGMEDAIFIIRQVIEKAQEHRVPLHFNFVDSKAAFDTIWRKPLCAEVIDGQLTEWFAVQIGLR